MNFTITGLAYGADPPAWPRGGTPSIAGFVGDFLYTHADSDGSGGVRITIDQNPVSSSNAHGTVTQIVLKYTVPSVPPPAPQQMVWDNPGVPFGGGQLDIHLQLLGTEDSGDVVLVVNERPQHIPTVPDVGTFGLLVIGPSVDASKGPRAYFIDVPVGSMKNATSARTKFPHHGGVSGPIGSVNVP